MRFDENDQTIITTHEVIPQGSVWVGVGTDDEGNEVRYGGDARMMSGLADLIEEHGSIDAAVESWAILSVSKAA